MSFQILQAPRTESVVDDVERQLDLLRLDLGITFALTAELQNIK
jgi:hypothetical protein